jgi:flagellar hook-associated protein 2
MQQALQLQLTTEPDNQISAMQALTALQSYVQTFQTATYTLTASQSWSSVTGSSSNPSAFTFTTTTGAQPANYSVNISQLAQNEFYVGTSGFASNVAAIATGSFFIQPTTLNSGTAVTITVDSTNDTWQGLESAINNDTSTTGVQAGIIYNGSTYQLSLSSDQTGTNYAFSMTGSASNQFRFSALANVSATNASLTLDNIPITSQTNSFVNAMPNVVI